MTYAARPPARQWVLAGIAGAMLLGASWGCPPPAGTGIHDRPEQRSPPRPLEDIVATISQNAAKLDRALWSNSVHVVARMKDSNSGEHSFSFDGSLLFQAPHSLRMDLRHGLGTPVMQVGSNDAAYWAWVEPEMHHMWWGRHEFAGRPCVQAVSVRPEQMVAVLGVGGLPDTADGLIGPIRAFGNQYDILYYARKDEAGRLRFVRQYYVDRASPYQIRLIAFLDDYGRKQMTAFLDEYRAAWEGGPVIAHAVSIFWPEDDGRFTLKMDRVTSKSPDDVSSSAYKLPVPAELPASVRDHIEQIDEWCESASPGANGMESAAPDTTASRPAANDKEASSK